MRTDDWTSQQLKQAADMLAKWEGDKPRILQELEKTIVEQQAFNRMTAEFLPPWFKDFYGNMRNAD